MHWGVKLWKRFNFCTCLTNTPSSKEMTKMKPEDVATCCDDMGQYYKVKQAVAAMILNNHCWKIDEGKKGKERKRNVRASSQHPLISAALFPLVLVSCIIKASTDRELTFPNLPLRDPSAIPVGWKWISATSEHLFFTLRNIAAKLQHTCLF